jgi:hypothetical protein
LLVAACGGKDDEQNDEENGGAFHIVALNNPVGNIRSVENTNGVPLWHPIGMHPYGMPTTTGTLPFLPSDSFLRNE